MPSLLSGKVLRAGGSGQYLNVQNAQPQLPKSPTTSTGYTIVTDSLLNTTYRSSLGNVEFNQGSLWSNIPNGNLSFVGTGTGVVSIPRTTASTGSSSGALVVAGGIGVAGAIYTGADINVNGITIGQGYASGLNNIVIKGVAGIQINDFNNGQESIAIGYNALDGLSTAYKSIAIGRYALNSGTLVSNSIAIGDRALQLSGSVQALLVANISAISASSATVVTALAHTITSGTQITLSGIVGMTALNDRNFYASRLTADTIKLYSDINLTYPINSTLYSAYVSGGSVSRVLLRNNNIAIGVGAGSKLIDGMQNFFFGDSIANNLTTGSFNFFAGHQIGNNMTHGNSNISIGGGNLVDGQDNQINLGSVFYYDGLGNLRIDSTATTIYGSLKVTNGIDGIITTATNINLGARGSLPYQIAGGKTAMLGIGSTGTVLFSSGAYPYWDYVSSTSTVKSVLSTDTVNVIPVNTNTTYYVTLADHIGGITPIKADVTLKYDTISNLLTTTKLAITDSATSAVSATGQSVEVTGGVGIHQDLYVASAVGVGKSIIVGDSVTVGNSLLVTNTVTSSAVQLGYAAITSTSVQVNSTTKTTIDTFLTSQFRSAKYLIQISDGVNFQVMEILLLIDNSSTVYATEYGILASNGELGEFSAEVLGGTQMMLYFQSFNSTVSTIKISRTGISV